MKEVFGIKAWNKMLANIVRWALVVCSVTLGRI
jgi:hypothetical protein